MQLLKYTNSMVKSHLWFIYCHIEDDKYVELTCTLLSSVSKSDGSIRMSFVDHATNKLSDY